MSRPREKGVMYGLLWAGLGSAAFWMLAYFAWRGVR